MIRKPWLSTVCVALLTVATCSSLTTQQPDGTLVAGQLPPFPVAVPSTRGPVPVRLVHRMQRCGEKADTTVVWYGCYHYGPPRFIEIEDTLSLAWRWRTLRHEMVHLALALDGATLPDADAENRVAEALAKQEFHAMAMRWPR